MPSSDCATSADSSRDPSPPRRLRAFLLDRCRAVTLVESMFALGILAMFMLGFLGTFVQSRRITESSILHAAATSMIYGLIEQMKGLDYSSLPNNEADPYAPAYQLDGVTPLAPPYIRVRINQNTVKWLQVVHTLASTVAAPTTPMGPTETPAANVAAANVVIATTGVATPVSSPAIDNWIGSIPLSTVTGSTSQQINLDIWIWVDDLAAEGTWAAEATQPLPDSTEVRKITIVYTYSYQDGSRTRTIRDREVFLRTRYDQ